MNFFKCKENKSGFSYAWIILFKYISVHSELNAWKADHAYNFAVCSQALQYVFHQVYLEVWPGFSSLKITTFRTTESPTIGQYSTGLIFPMNSPRHQKRSTLVSKIWVGWFPVFTLRRLCVSPFWSWSNPVQKPYIHRKAKQMLKQGHLTIHSLQATYNLILSSFWARTVGNLPMFSGGLWYIGPCNWTLVWQQTFKVRSRPNEKCLHN